MNQFSELSYLGFKRFRPHPALRPWVQCYWSIKHPALPGRSREYFYPDGGSSLNFDLTHRDPRAVSFDARQDTRSVCFQKPNRSFGIRFYPGGAFQLLGLPVRNLLGGDFAASQIGVSVAEELYDVMLEADDFQSVQLVDKWLCHYAASSNCRSGIVEKLIPRLTQTELSVAKALQNIGASRRTLERLFREQVGVSPGQLKAWFRAGLARQLIKSNHTLSLTQVGAACGYHDQSHFIRQFENITTFTPGRYRERQLARLTTSEEL